jgi:hypothetical protein
MNENTEQLLDLCFEIEGLLSLIQKRGEDTPNRVKDMLREKTSQLAAAINASTPQACEHVTEDKAIAESAELEEEEYADPGTQPAVDANVSLLDDDLINESADATTKNNSQAQLQEPFTFTLNDKFRFRRELFGNNAAEFADALNVASAMSSQAELDDYFYNDLCWDPENPDVIDFMKIISARFNK